MGSRRLGGCSRRGESFTGVLGFCQRGNKGGLPFTSPDFVARIVYEREGAEVAEGKEVAGGGASDRRIVHAEATAGRNYGDVAWREYIHENGWLALLLQLLGNAGPDWMG